MTNKDAAPAVARPAPQAGRVPPEGGVAVGARRRWQRATAMWDNAITPNKPTSSGPGTSPTGSPSRRVTAL